MASPFFEIAMLLHRQALGCVHEHTASIMDLEELHHGEAPVSPEASPRQITKILQDGRCESRLDIRAKCL
jgi:hypothetical protein